ncbi:uroporphyrinogen-III C-methyltransferase [bacterium BMS3Abin02]|nr:uroporphyrinogen-III C-methyltransferase [bacterium BMS3Abin02]GBE21924.1 uroporphyrinogen-III C-methyltransferase [bacterium BMS3Bbin01]
MRLVTGNDAAAGQPVPVPSGKVFLVGAGPGDPELLTLKALRVLEEADVVLYDRLVSHEIVRMADSATILIAVGKRPGSPADSQDRINAMMLTFVALGKTVVRLKGGDPLIFGRGGEEWEYLRRHNIEAELVPGITSATSVPGVAGIPLTRRGVAESFAVITGHKENGSMPKWSRYAGIDTLVILMGVRFRVAIARDLIAAGRSPDEPAAFVQKGTTPGQVVVVTSLGEIAADRLTVRTPAILVVGYVVELRATLVSRAPVPPPIRPVGAVRQAGSPVFSASHAAGAHPERATSALAEPRGRPESRPSATTRRGA